MALASNGHPGTQVPRHLAREHTSVLAVVARRSALGAELASPAIALEARLIPFRSFEAKFLDLF
jgi:hypothetical protein